MLTLTSYRCLGEAFRDAFVAFKTEIAFIEAERRRENGRWTFAEARRRAEGFGANLQALGLRQGDRCAILLPNQARWCLSALGALWAGATLVPLDHKLSAREQAALLGRARPKVLVVDWPTWRGLGSKDGWAGVDATVVVCDAPDDADLRGAVRWSDVARTELVPVDPAPDDVACIVFSSGTGGVPRGCMLTHRSYLAQAEQLGRLFPVGPGDRYFSVLPTNHAIDFMCGFVLALLMGSAVVHQRTLRPEFLAWTFRRYRITHVALVPLTLKALEQKIRAQLAELAPWRRKLVDGLTALNAAATQHRPNHALSRTLLGPVHAALGGRLKLIFAGGAFLDRATAEFFYRLGLPVVIGYGLTEAGTVLTVNDLSPFRGDTVGRPLPGVDLELRDVGPDGVGEVYVRAPTVMTGYLEAPELTAETLVDGWLRTGDLGSVDAAGHLKLVGRAKNMVVTAGGKNVYPEDIENHFDDLTQSEEHCVLASGFIWPGGGLTGEQLIIVVRPRPNADSAGVLAEVQAKNQRLPDHKRAGGLLLWADAFPRTASLKVKRLALAKEILARHPGRSAPTALRSVEERAS
jgi:long-chain acyl-CoA synthetase